MRNSNADHNAYIVHQKQVKHQKLVAQWLRANPAIGELNGGKYYTTVDNETVMLTVFQEI